MDPHLLRDDQLSEFREIFEIFKDERTNRIPLRSLLRIRSDLGFVETEETLSTRVASLVSAQASTAGLLFKDYLTFVAVEQVRTSNDVDAGVDFEAELRAVFRRLDLKGDGVLDAEEILAATAATSPSKVEKTPRNADVKVSFEDDLKMEDAESVLDDAVKRAKEKRGFDEEKYADSWLEFERTEKSLTCVKKTKDGNTLHAGGATGGVGGGGSAASFCLDFRGFKELMRD